MRRLNEIFLIWVLYTVFSVTCLFEDQAGTYDWRQQYVGKPTFSHVDFTTKKFFVGTDQNLLGAMNIKNGNIAWRKIFESNELGRIDHVLWGSTEVLVITGNGQRIQSFNYNNGFANWEYVLFNKNDNKKFTGIESLRDKEAFYFTDSKQICYVSFKEKICVDLPNDGGYVYENLYESSKGVFIVGYKEKSIQQIQYTFSLSSIVTKSVSPDNGKLDWITTNKNCLKLVDSDQVVCFSNDQIYTQKSDNQMVFDSFDVPRSLPKDATLVWASKDSYVLESRDLNNDDFKSYQLYVLKPSTGNQLTLSRMIQDLANYSVESKDGEFFVVYAKYNDLNELSFTVLNLTNEDKTDLVVKVVINEKEPSSILQLKANLMETKSGQLGLLTFCFFEDYTMSIFNSQGDRYFTREEALAYISAVEMIDFPLSHLQEELEDEFNTSSQENIINMFIKRIRMQMVQLREYLMIDLYQKIVSFINSNNPNKRPPSVSSSVSPLVSVEELTRDVFNLNKIIVVATTVGKVYGLYTSANGQILWSFYLKNTLPFETALNKKSVSMFLQRSASHVSHDPQAVFVSKYKKQGSESQGIAFFFNPLTGQAARDFPKDGVLMDYSVKQAFLAPAPDANFLKQLVILDHTNTLHVMPDTDILKGNWKTNVIYNVETISEKESLLTGYLMSYKDKPLLELWRMKIEDETIQAIGTKLPHDRIHTHGKVLGDRSVLYKYLNPSLIGVITTGEDSQRIAFVNVYLIDTVTGSIVNSFNHKKCRGPVNIVHSENWFFYSYYNMKNRRNEVSSVELFEGSRQFNATGFSSFDDIKPIFYSKSYVVQKAFNAMQVTLTEKGITTKDVVVACQSGIIIDIPWILIDPRRPMKMTEVEKEENLLPYMPEIPLNYEFSLNYYNYVYNVRGITTAPSGLESTSLVFAYGLDIYFTRVFPSKTFDLLREDFDYLFVTTLVFGLLIGTFLAKKLASSSNLQKAWK